MYNNCAPLIHLSVSFANEAFLLNTIFSSVFLSAFQFIMDDKSALPSGKSRGRGRPQPFSLAGAGGDNQTSTLNAEAPEFRPPVSLMEHMHLDQTRYGGHQSNYAVNHQTMGTPQYSQVVSGAAFQSGDAADLVQATVLRIRKQDKVQAAAESLLKYLIGGKGVEDVIAVAKSLTSLGANEDRSKSDAIFQLAVHLADKLRQPSRSFSQFMLREMGERLHQWHHTCISNSGFVPQCAPFLVMLGELFPALAPLARGQTCTVQLGLTIISFLNVLLQSQDVEAHQQALHLLMQLGPTLHDELMMCDKEGPGAEANTGTGASNTLESFYADIRRSIAQRRFTMELAINFIELLELRAANWGRLFHRQTSNEGGLLRQNSEAMMDDEMYECYERFLAETGQI